MLSYSRMQMLGSTDPTEIATGIVADWHAAVPPPPEGFDSWAASQIVARSEGNFGLARMTAAYFSQSAGGNYNDTAILAAVEAMIAPREADRTATAITAREAAIVACRTTGGTFMDERCKSAAEMACYNRGGAWNFATGTCNTSHVNVPAAASGCTARGGVFDMDTLTCNVSRTSAAPPPPPPPDPAIARAACEAQHGVFDPAANTCTITTQVDNRTHTVVTCPDGQHLVNDVCEWPVDDASKDPDWKKYLPYIGAAALGLGILMLMRSK